MLLVPGARLGPYEVIASIGAGGMGEVYRARDTSLDRDVAIKVLPELLATDPDRVVRFAREAKTLASLNHANIAHIHGVLESPLALVMELVEGEDLAERLARGAMPLEDVIPIAKQIADALECAHEQGIIHRDLKPANVKVRPDGVVKVLDFGLAKALSAQPEGAPSSSALLLSPTFTSPAMTQMGIILGTAAYMAPEQARGKVVDKRADVWAFGVVLFEMLSGTRAFEGSEVSDTLAFVLTKEPAWNALPAETPGPIRRLLRRCLHKDRKQRLADISDARLELEEALVPAESSATGTHPPARRSRMALVGAALLLAGIAVGVGIGRALFFPPPEPRPVTKFLIELPDGQDFSNTGRHFINISHDGSRVVYTAGSQLRVRHLGSFTSSDVPGSPAAAVINPVFSPDGEAIAFYVDNTLRRIPTVGGVPLLIASEISNPYGMFWAESGIYLGQGPIGIVRVPPGGGKPEVIAKVSDKERAQGPQVLPDGDTLIFTVYPTTGDQRFDLGKIYAQSLRTGERKLLHEGGSDGQVLPSGHLVFGNGSVMYAMPFDARTLTASGTPTPVLPEVRRSPATGAMMFRVARNGTVIYAPGTATSANEPRTLAYLDRQSKLSPLSMVGAHAFDTPRLSPDGTRIAAAVRDDAQVDIWIQDLRSKSALRRLTFSGSNRWPQWSPDGRQIAFASRQDDGDAIYVQDADVSGGAPQLLFKGGAGETLTPTAWSAGGWLAVTVGKDGRAAVHAFSLADRKLLPVASGPGSVTGSAAFSPDGRWIAYNSFGGPLAAPVVFVEPFPVTGAKYQLGGGIHPVWASGGRELIVNTTSQRMAIYSFSASPRVEYSPIAEIDRSQIIAPPVAARQFDAADDGQRLLVVTAATSVAPPAREIRVIQNWFEELKK